MAGEEGGVAGKSFGVAADVDNAARVLAATAAMHSGVLPCARRVEEYDIRVRQAFACGGGHPLGSIGADKLAFVDHYWLRRWQRRPCTAAGLRSTPMTCFALRAAHRPMVPMPQ